MKLTDEEKRIKIAAEQTAQQLRLAATIIETGHPWEYNHDEDFWQKSSGTSVLFAVSEGWPIRLAFATPPDGRALHNPDSLTAEQVGAGWRLLAQGEPKVPHAEFWATNEEWTRSTSESTFSNQTYRVPRSVPWPEAKPEAPFQLPPPPPGMQWHTDKDWKEGDLPQGWRLLVRGEFIEDGDEVHNPGLDAVRFVAARDSTGSMAGSLRANQLCRTRRPLTFEHAGKQWTWHRPGDPMPCDGEAKIRVLTVGLSFWTTQGKDLSWANDQGNARIIGWRYADEKKTVPLGPEDVKPFTVIRRKGEAQTWHWRTVSYVDAVKVTCGNRGYGWIELASSYERNESLPLTGKWDTNAWEPCNKQI